MSLQARPDADIDTFFKLENQREPPSLSDWTAPRYQVRYHWSSTRHACSWPLSIGQKCYCGSTGYGSSYAYHKTSACQYFWICNWCLAYKARWRIIHQEWTQSGTHIKRQVSSHRHVPSGMRLQEHECLPRFPSQRALSGRSFSKIVTIKMSYFGSLVRSFSGTELIFITSSSQQMLTWYSAINQLIWQPRLHASKKKTHGWCSIFITLLDRVTLRPFSGL